VFKRASECFGPIDILINNAGTYSDRAWFETTAETWKNIYEVDVLSAVRLILLAVPDMKSRGWGRIIQIGTGLATTPQPVMADYSAAKAAMVNATVSLAKALSGSGITCNTISPGLIETPGVERVLQDRARRLNWGSDWQVIQKTWMEQVLGDRFTTRLGTPEEVADLVAFVASPRAGYIHGANIRIDGGHTSSIN
jgi:NAD(P)-dependent dehydrogenase (short-subunit alcohol dehydrogenase family)